ncbi:SynChlorMet cassette radical SAM/SPASM protein ScmF [Methanocella sp. MCL-LM]|uniref:SynChlorMet cassette radical SAM/SPASM protein ScmF n=1 Tax=Methanocella sp. MCL-LM TaxID=3412035 RepID=UPI003C765A90
MKEPSEKDVRRIYPLRQIYFYLTSDCNLRCRHCWISPDFQSATTSSAYLPVDLFKKIVSDAKGLGLTDVKLTGGEPLLHPQILDILEFIRSQGLSVNIETNGVLCTPEIARAIASCKAYHVAVSLDGVNAETHEWVRGVDGCFDDAVQGIKNLVEAGVRPQIIMTLMRRNQDQAEAMIDLAASLKASTVKFNIVMPTLRGEAMHAAGETLTIEELVELGSRMERTIAPGSPLPLNYGHPLAFRPLGNMFHNIGGGCAACGVLRILGVLADGTYALCGIGEAIPELTYGNAHVDNVFDVWENAPFLQELRAGLPGRLEGICGDCIIKNLCLGSCIAQNYYRKGSLWAPFWFCEEARNSGIFPKSRLYQKNL